MKRMVHFREIELFKSIKDVEDFMVNEDEFVLAHSESSNSVEFEAYKKLSTSFQNGLRFTCFLSDKSEDFLNLIKRI